MIFFLLFILQSPTESINSDSRPESVIDDQENTSEPPESSLSVNVPKDSEEKLEDPLSIAIMEPLSCVSSNEKDEEVEEESNQGPSIDPSSEPVDTEPVVDDSTEVKVDTKLPNDEEDDDQNSASTENAPQTGSSVSQPDQANSFAAQPSTGTALVPSSAINAALSPNPFAAKDEEMISAIANMKQETTSTTAGAVNYASKDVLYIKKEPGDDSTDNSNSNEPHDLKVKVEIKTEKKPEASEQEPKFDEEQASATKPPSFEGHIKYGMPDPHMKYGMDASKYGDPMKFPHENPNKYPTDMTGPMKYPPPEALKYNQDAVMKYDMKPYLDNPPKYADESMKSYPEGPLKMEQPQMLKGGPYQTEPADMKYNPEQHKYTIPPEAMKYENEDGPVGLNKHPYPDAHSAHRSPYDQPQPMMKFGEQMSKFHGMPPTSSNPQDMKYLSSPDMKYRVQDGSVKSQYSADNLIKSSAYPDHLNAMKYPPTDSHIDNSARSTPNQDSQGSNSNFQTQLHSHGNPSPQTRVGSPQNQPPHLTQSQAAPLILSHPGLPSHHGSSHLPSNHPSLLSSSASPTVMPSGLTQQSQHLHGPSNMPPGLSSGLNSANPSIIPPTSASSTHPTLHRPHQDIPSPLHHPLGAFSSGIPPSHSASSHNQSPSANINNSRQESDRIERRDGGLHHRVSPVGGLIPANSSGLLTHPSIPHMHLGGPAVPSVALPLLSAHHSSHLGPPLLPPTTPIPNAPLPLISSHSGSGLSDGRHTPISAPPSSTHAPTPTTASSAFSRTSPSVQYASLPPSSAHRTNSPSQPPSSLTRGSPLHLPHHSSASALSAAAAAAAERDRQALMRQQSPHMTPPPVSSASLIASPLSKMYGQPPRSLGASPPPHHLRPGASPPVLRHPQMPLPLPMSGSMPNPMGMHPAHNPYSHHLIHPMFYPHQHNPFNPPYSYHPYSPAGYQFMARPPPPNASLEASVMSHHQSVTSRCEETPTHVDKQMTISSSQSIHNKVTIDNLPPVVQTLTGLSLSSSDQTSSTENSTRK